MVAKSEKKQGQKMAEAEKKIAKVEEAVADEEVGARAMRRKMPVTRNHNRVRQAGLHKTVATAHFLSCLFNPFDCPSRMPDKMQMLNTVVLPFRQTATFTGTTGGSPNRLAFDVYPVLQRSLFMRTGTTTWGSTSISDASSKMFSAASGLTGFVLASRCVGQKVHIEYASPFTGSQGVLYAAIVPPGYGGGAPVSSTLSQYPNSATASITTLSATGAFDFVWLPQRAAGDYLATYEGEQLNAPYDPTAFIPFNGDTTGTPASMPFISVIAEGMGNLAVFMVTIEACFECDVICGGLLGSDDRPDDDAWEVLDDLAEPLFQKNTRVQPMTVESQRSAVAPQQTIVQQAVAGAPASMSQPTAEFLDNAESVLSKAGSKAWDLVKEYGPDALSSVVGLLPGGSIATTAAKVGSALAKWLM